MRPSSKRRAYTPEQDRKDFFLYVDEVQNFLTDSFASLLSESRKYRLCLTLSHQFTRQLDEPVLKAILGNVGTTVAFRIGREDAYQLSREFDDQIAASTFTELSNHQVAVKLLSGGSYSGAFVGTTLPPLGKRFGKEETIITRSREKYTLPRKTLEDKIERWLKRN